MHAQREIKRNIFQKKGYMIYNEGDQIEISIGEHTYITPPIPPKKDILFSKNKQKDQYWTRQKDFPKIFFDWHNDPTPEGLGVELDAKETRYHDNGQLLTLSKEDTGILFDNLEENGREGLQQREMRRRMDGIWFMNNGVPTYLTGDHYAALQWLKMLGCDNEVDIGSEYGQYVEFQRDVCYYFKICEETTIAYGGVLVKSKKTGITQLVSCIALNRAMILRQKNIRMMSITESVCKEINFRFIRHAMEGVPHILMPSRSKQNEGEVVFGAPNASRNPLKKSKATNLQYLNNWLCTVPTSRTSFDSATNYIAIIDEWPKIKESTYPEELFTATIIAVKEGTKRKGTVFAPSYVPEITDRSYREAKKIYFESKLKTRLKNQETGEPYGKTMSELLCHTLTAQEGIFGCCDKYGKADAGKVWDYVRELKDKAKNDPVKLQSIQRQYPTNENDPWSEGMMSDTLFDNLRLAAKADKLLEDQSMGVFPYVDFNLEFEKEPVKEKVGEKYTFEGKIKIKYITDKEKMAGAEHGRFKWFRKEWTPDWFLNKYLNKTIQDPKTKLLKPNPDSPFFISMDPTNYRIKKHTGKGSLNSFQVFILPNAEINAEIGRNVTNRRLMVTYLYRRDRPSDTLSDMIMLILLFGCMVQIESNMAVWATKLIEMGLGNFVLMVNKDGALEPWSEYKEQHLFTSEKSTIDQYVDAGAEFLGAPLKPNEIDNIDYLDDIDTIMQLMQIKKDNTTDWDAAVAYLEGLMGINAWLGWKRAQEGKNKGNDGIRHFAKMMH